MRYTYGADTGIIRSIMEDYKTISGNKKEANALEENLKTIPVIEEHLRIETKIVETGKVHISKKVHEEVYHTDVPVFKEEVIVERKVINEFVEGNAPGIRLDGEVTIIPVIKEVIVKRLLLVEELYVTKKRTETTIPVNETLRQEEINISRTEISAPEKEQ